jgi:hypothetical protein
MYITTSYNLCSICIRNMEEFKFIPIFCTHVYSYIIKGATEGIGNLLEYRPLCRISFPSSVD